MRERTGSGRSHMTALGRETLNIYMKTRTRVLIRPWCCGWFTSPCSRSDRVPYSKDQDLQVRTAGQSESSHLDTASDSCSVSTQLLKPPPHVFVCTPPPTCGCLHRCFRHGGWFNSRVQLKELSNTSSSEVSVKNLRMVSELWLHHSALWPHPPADVTMLIHA